MAFEDIGIVFSAGVLTSLLPWRDKPTPLEVDCLLVKLRIFNGEIQMQMPGICAGPTFYRMQFVAMRVGVLIHPGVCIFETHGVDYKRVAIPTADLLAKVCRVRVFRMLAAIRWNQIGVRYCR
jgi:hypothetical protein